MARIFYLFLTIGLLPLGLHAVTSYGLTEEDSVRVDELFVKDTVLLDIDGPSNDVTFYMNGMVFLFSMCR